MSESCKLYEIWREKCILNIKEKLRLNMEARSKKLEEIVNERVINLNRELHLNDHNNNNNDLCQFKISSNIILSSLESMYKHLNDWNGVAISNCKTIPKSFEAYFNIADNWWNRQKNKWFGDTYFYYIFNVIYEYSHHLSSQSQLADDDDDALYGLYCDVLHFSILEDLFTATILFKRARAMPLLFDQSLEKSHILRSYCCQLLSIQIDKNEKKQKNKIKFRHIVHHKISQIKCYKFDQFIIQQQRNQQKKYQQQQQQQQQQPPPPPPPQIPMTLSTSNSVNSSNSSNSSCNPYQQQFVNDSNNYNDNDNNTVFCNYNNDNYNNTIFVNENSLFQNDDDMMSIFQSYNNNYNNYNDDDHSLF